LGSGWEAGSFLFRPKRKGQAMVKPDAKQPRFQGAMTARKSMK
jgi:hypothetical protein